MLEPLRAGLLQIGQFLPRLALALMVLLPSGTRRAGTSAIIKSLASVPRLPRVNSALGAGKGDQRRGAHRHHIARAKSERRTRRRCATTSWMVKSCAIVDFRNLVSSLQSQIHAESMTEDALASRIRDHFFCASARSIKGAPAFANHRGTTKRARLHPELCNLFCPRHWRGARSDNV